MMRYLLPLLLPLAACAATGTAAPLAGPSAAGRAAPPAAFASERIGVTVVGSGPDVVLIHGLSSSAEVWTSTVAAMPGYRYHLVQVSGMGGRAPGANADGEVVGPVAEEIARYIHEAGLQRPAIVGHSLGGAWGMMVTARHPELVGKLMVVDMLPFLGAMFGGPGATPETVRPLAEQFRQGIASSTGPQRDAIVKSTIDTMVRTESLRPLALRHSLASDPAVSGQAMYDLITTDLMPELKNIRVPMTVLWVRAPNAPVTDAQMAGFYKLAYANVPHARVAQVPNSYHFIMWDEPAAFQRELKSFLGGS
jgi:pimeloyl-ACP methyl ester carboxylesterase